MKKTLLLLLIAFSTVSFAKNSFCNFSLELKGNIEMNKTYKLVSFSYTGISKRKEKGINKRINFNLGSDIVVALVYLQKKLEKICRYKKYEINKVQISLKELGVQLKISYEPIPKESKSKD